MRRLMRWLLTLLVMALAWPATAQTGPEGPIQYLPSIAGDYFAVDSAAADHRYHVFVRYPNDYAVNPDRRYPVVYLLDGDSLFPMLAPLQLLLHYDEELPEAIVVGIAYGSFAPPVNRRDFDFTPPAPDAGENEGGARQFLRFLKEELIPQLESRVRADPARRVLVGQSRSGYMVLWTAFAEPDLFWGRIASNPTFAPGREQLFSPVPPGGAIRDDLGVVLISGSRERSSPRRAAALEWGERWVGAADAPWDAQLVDLEGGTHAANIADAYRAGMLWLFRREGR